jgi:hypothetical protein
MPPEKFRALADEVAAKAFIRGEEFKTVCAGGLRAMVEAATSGGQLAPDDTAHITTLAQTFDIDLHRLPNAGSRLAKASVLRELTEGRLPTGIEVEGPVLLNFECNEVVIWVFNNVACYSLTRGDNAATHSQQVGHAGVTMRINGAEAFAGNADAASPAKDASKKKSWRRSETASAEATQGLTLEGTGDLVLTSKHLSFLSDAIAIRIPLRQIVALVPHADGLRVLREEASGRPQTFVVDDPSFAATAITLLNRI